jgi:hypothetical protein
MANTIIALKQSGATGNTPLVNQLEFGELAINYADGILYFKTSSNTLGSVRTTQPAGLSSEVQFNDAGSFGGDSSFTFNKDTNTLTVDNATVGGINVAPTLQASFDKANSANVLAQAAFDKANTAETIATGAFSFANTVNVFTQSSFDKANSANVLAQAAFDTANNAASIGDVLAIAIALG